MNITYRKIQRIVDLIDDEMKGIKDALNPSGTSSPNYNFRFKRDEELTDDEKDLKLLEEIKEDFLSEVNKISFVFEVQSQPVSKLKEVINSVTEEKKNGTSESNSTAGSF